MKKCAKGARGAEEGVFTVRGVLHYSTVHAYTFIVITSAYLIRQPDPKNTPHLRHCILVQKEGRAQFISFSTSAYTKF